VFAATVYEGTAVLETAWFSHLRHFQRVLVVDAGQVVEVVLAGEERQRTELSGREKERQWHGLAPHRFVLDAVPLERRASGGQLGDRLSGRILRAGQRQDKHASQPTQHRARANGAKKKNAQAFFFL